MPGRANQAGFTYLGVLFFVTVMGVLLATAGGAWQTHATRDREEELLFVGDQYRKAIAAYFNASPGAPRYPRELADLVKDPRHAGTVRHLRKLYRDPITGGEWGLVQAPDGGIAGVYSRSEARPFKLAGFGREYAQFEGQVRYADWRFVHQRPAGGATRP